MNTDKPLAAVSFDLDNLWSYLKTHGEPGCEDFPSYIHIVVPKVLDILRQLDLKITFFIVGKDATFEKNKKYFAQLAAEGHEVANHSFWHEPWFSFYSKERTRQEIIDAEQAITEATGERPKGFRCPGFSTNRFLYDFLADRCYFFDTSSLPTFLGPLARAYYFKTAALDNKEKNLRVDLFGDFRNGLKPIKPYLWKLRSGKEILEIPITTIPFLKIPFHLSYLMYIARYSEELMHQYLNLAIWACKLSRTPVNFVVHPLDLIGKEEAPRLTFFPAMDIWAKKKKRIFLRVIRTLSKHFRLVRMDVFASFFLKSRNIRVIRSY